MRALVLEVRGGQSAVLADDGIIYKTDKVYKVGDTVDVDADIISLAGEKKRRKNSMVKKLAYTAAACAIVITGAGVSYQTAFACTYVSVDINPSIEFALNRMDRVLTVSALNDDAKEIVDEIQSVRFCTLSEALEETARVLNDNDYLTEQAVVLVDIASDSTERIEKLSDEVRASYKVSTGFADAELYLATSDLKMRSQAYERDMSTGRYESLRSDKAGMSDKEDAVEDDSVDSVDTEDVQGATDTRVIDRESADSTDDSSEDETVDKAAGSEPDEKAVRQKKEETAAGSDDVVREGSRESSEADKEETISEEYREKPVSEIVGSIPDVEKIDPSEPEQTSKPLIPEQPQGTDTQQIPEQPANVDTQPMKEEPGDTDTQPMPERPTDTDTRSMPNQPFDSDIQPVPEQPTDSDTQPMPEQHGDTDRQPMPEPQNNH